MSYSLTSFSSDFFFKDGDDNLSSSDIKNPKSVYQALRCLSDSDWEEIAEELKCDPEYLDIDMVLEVIQETDTCTDLKSPVEVWIDQDGYHTILVWDE